METAEDLFYKQGYNATGINQVIEEAGIAKASLYKHFESKTDLLIAYLQRFHENSSARLQAFVDNVQDPKEKLLALFDYHKERQFFRQYGGCPFVKANNEAGNCDLRVLNEIQGIKQHMKSFIKNLVANSGHASPLSDSELTELIFVTLEGSIVGVSIFKKEDDLLAAKAIIQKLI